MRFSASGVPPDRVYRAYRDRELGALSDHRLFVQAAELVSRPVSFELHAPLDLLTRARSLHRLPGRYP